jgi:hypothetical protein
VVRTVNTISIYNIASYIPVAERGEAFIYLAWPLF